MSKVAKGAVRVVTEMYEFAHGRKPTGYGCWMFAIAGERFEARGSYSECKKQAVAEAVRVGSYEVKVMS